MILCFIAAYKAPVAAPTINPALYAITPKDHVKYHELFLTYDHDKDGLVSVVDLSFI